MKQCNVNALKDYWSGLFNGNAPVGKSDTVTPNTYTQTDSGAHLYWMKFFGLYTVTCKAATGELVHQLLN